MLELILIIFLCYIPLTIFLIMFSLGFIAWTEETMQLVFPQNNVVFNVQQCLTNKWCWQM